MGPESKPGVSRLPHAEAINVHQGLGEIHGAVQIGGGDGPKAKEGTLQTKETRVLAGTDLGDEDLSKKILTRHINVPRVLKCLCLV